MKNKLAWFSAPYVLWMALFTVIPVIMVVVYAFTAVDLDTGAVYPTLENFSNMGTYAVVFVRSFRLALIATIICLLIGYPVSYLMAKEGPGFQRIAMVLIMLPMWVNFLLRTYAWMTILSNNGPLNHLFQALGIIDLGNLINGGLNGLCAWLNSGALELINSLLGTDFALNTARPTDMTYFKMLYTQGAVVLGMVYNYLPFMILPIYSVIIKLDHSLLEAARDLGASSSRVFRKVILPLSLPGVLSGITMVFVPSVSTFAISKMLGGGTQLLLGDLIELQFLGGAYNPYVGSAISLVMMIIVVICMYVMNRFGEGEEQAVML
jgi:spermidine/putrescine transport system permease protein